MGPINSYLFPIKFPIQIVAAGYVGRSDGLRNVSTIILKSIIDMCLSSMYVYNNT